MPFIEYVGLFGAFLSAITFIPQVLHAYKTKSVGDLSWVCCGLFLLALSCGLFMGFICAYCQLLLPMVLSSYYQLYYYTLKLRLRKTKFYIVVS